LFPRFHEGHPRLAPDAVACDPPADCRVSKANRRCLLKPIIRCAIAVLCVVFASLAGAQQPANATPPLRGHVRSAGGQPLPDAEVNVDGARSSVRTDATGAFSVPNLSKGIHTISVRRIGYLPAAVEIETPQANDALTFTLVPSRQELDTVKVRARINVLGGIVVDARNRPIAGATVDLIGDRLRGSADTTGDDGWFTFTAVRSGPIVLHVVKEGYVGVTQSIDLKDWRGVVVHMASMDTTLSKSKQRMLAGLGNTSRHVWLETLQRLSRRNVQSIVVTREELAPLGDIPLGEAITRAPSAVNLLRDMQVSRNVACVLLNGYQMIGQVSLDNYDSDDVEFVELYPSYMRPPSSVMAYMGIAGCSSARSALMDSGGILYAVVWMKN
jgi:hypothetical protein